MHSSQTGSREILIRGVPQRRQSEGNRVAKRLSATPLTEETREDTRELSRTAALVPVVRIGSPLLLKTTSLVQPVLTGAPSGRIFLSINGAACWTQRVEHASRCGAVGQPRVMAFPHRHKYGPVTTPKAIATADGTQQQQRQQVLLGEGSGPGAVPLRAATVLTLKRFG